MLHTVRSNPSSKRANMCQENQQGEFFGFFRLEPKIFSRLTSWFLAAAAATIVGKLLKVSYCFADLKRYKNETLIISRQHRWCMFLCNITLRSEALSLLAL